MRLDRPGWCRSVAFFVLLSPSGCTALGERLYSGECPEGETCSHEAPGARFIGEPVIGDELRFLDTAWNPTAAFEVRAGGQTFTPKLDVVTEVDDVVLGCPGPYAWLSSLVLKVGDDRQACFRALRAGASVGGAAWHVEATPHLDVGYFLPNVVALRGLAAGKGSLAVTVAGVTRTFPYEVTP